MDRWVEISFDCLPLRTIPRLDIPLDASPKFRERCLRIKAALEKHGSHNSYFLYNAQCVFHVLNDPQLGRLLFSFEGTVLTDPADQATVASDLEVRLSGETCSWLTEPIVEWFRETVPRAVQVEFDRYIRVGDLEQTKLRLEKIQQASDAADGFLGMHL